MCPRSPHPPPCGRSGRTGTPRGDGAGRTGGCGGSRAKSWWNDSRSSFASFLGEQLLCRNDEWRITHDAQPAVDDGGELAQGLEAVPGASLDDDLRGTRRHVLGGPRPRLARRCLELGEQAGNVNVRVPDIQSGHPRQAGHLPAIARSHFNGGGTSFLGCELTVPGCDDHAGGEPLEVPLPRPRQGLVKVVDVEHQLALRRGEQPEVGQVGIAANLGVQARPRRGRQIGGHDQRGSTEEGEWRDQHPPITDGNELGHPGGGLPFEEADRVWTVRPRAELRLGRSGCPSAGVLSDLCSLCEGEVRNGVSRRLWGLCAIRHRSLDPDSMSMPGVPIMVAVVARSTGQKTDLEGRHEVTH